MKGSKEKRKECTILKIRIRRMELISKDEYMGTGRVRIHYVDVIGQY